jgi:hypothetical protein
MKAINLCFNSFPPRNTHVHLRRYHLLQPEYVLSRLQALQRAYRLTVLLLLVDAEEVGGTVWLQLQYSVNGWWCGRAHSSVIQAKGVAP